MQRRTLFAVAPFLATILLAVGSQAQTIGCPTCSGTPCTVTGSWTIPAADLDCNLLYPSWDITFASGSSLTGNATQSILVHGRNITVNGSVGAGDTNINGNSVTVSGSVGGFSNSATTDLTATVTNVTINSGADVFALFSGTVTIRAKDGVTMNGEIDVSSGGTGHGGIINVWTGGHVTSAGGYYAYTTSEGNGGRVDISAGLNKALVLSGGSILVQGGLTGTDGRVTIGLARHPTNFSVVGKVCDVTQNSQVELNWVGIDNGGRLDIHYIDDIAGGAQPVSSGLVAVFCRCEPDPIDPTCRVVIGTGIVCQNAPPFSVDLTDPIMLPACTGGCA